MCNSMNTFEKWNISESVEPKKMDDLLLTKLVTSLILGIVCLAIGSISTIASEILHLHDFMTVKYSVILPEFFAIF